MPVFERSRADLCLRVRTPCLRFPDVLEPVSAAQTAPNQVEVTFNADLQPGALDAANWSAKAGITPAAATSAEAGPSSGGGGGGANVVRVTLDTSASFTSVSYSPPPFDVVSDGGGVTAAAFTDFPVT